MQLSAREYKAMLDHGRFNDRSSGIDQFWEELRDLAAMSDVARLQGDFSKKDKRSISFLDTPDLTLARNGLVLRLRSENGNVQYTLKCRSDDRYVAAGSDLRARSGLDAKQKLEEDIAPPFRCRFSHSNTVTLSEAHGPAAATLDQAAAIFPALGEIRIDGRACPGSTPLRRVHNITAFERVYAGPKLLFDGESRDDSPEASFALILWSNGEKGRSLAAEASFRLKDSDERYGPALARAARTIFSLLQRTDWCKPDAATKTQLVYQGSAGE